MTVLLQGEQKLIPSNSLNITNLINEFRKDPQKQMFISISLVYIIEQVTTYTR